MSEFIGCRFGGPPIAARLYLTNSDKRKRRNVRAKRAVSLLQGHLKS